jgi:pimeloyl-ACP methyl ester carboxylesterase
MNLFRNLAAAIGIWLAASTPSHAAADKSVNIGNNVVLHYVEKGAGPTVIFVHGSLGDYTYWQGQIDAFAQHYHVIAYSRRYNPPNSNAPISGYSAVVDSDDLAALIRKLNLGKVYIVGHSYGALTTLFLAQRHPELVRAAVLAEPPAMSLLLHLPADRAEEGQRMFADVQRRMVDPMKLAIGWHDTAKAVGIFMDYVFGKPGTWDGMSERDRSDALKGAHEWEIMLSKGEFFPAIDARKVREIKVPILLMSGGKSYPFLGLIDVALKHLLPDCHAVVFPDAGHQMWFQHPVEARAAAIDFFGAHP